MIRDHQQRLYLEISSPPQMDIMGFDDLLCPCLTSVLSPDFVFEDQLSRDLTGDGLFVPDGLAQSRRCLLENTPVGRFP